MPIYDFQCTSCGHKSEVMRKMSESNTTTCPHCKEEAFTKMLSAPSFQLNGTGWYATDFKTKNDKKSTGDKVSSGDKTNTSSEASTSSTETTAAACAPGCACH
jgi:putative FmdB family regulatory protein